MKRIKIKEATILAVCLCMVTCFASCRTRKQVNLGRFNFQYDFFIVDTFRIEQPICLRYRDQKGERYYTEETFVMSDTLLPEKITFDDFRRISKMNPPQVFISNPIGDPLSFSRMMPRTESTIKKYLALTNNELYVTAPENEDLIQVVSFDNSYSKLYRYKFNNEVYFILVMVRLEYLNFKMNWSWSDGPDCRVHRGGHPEDIYIPFVFPVKKSNKN